MKAHWGSIVCFFCVLLNVPGIWVGHWWALLSGLICAAAALLCFYFEQKIIKSRREIADITKQIRKGL